MNNNLDFTEMSEGIKTFLEEASASLRYIADEYQKTLITIREGYKTPRKEIQFVTHDNMGHYYADLYGDAQGRGDWIDLRSAEDIELHAGQFYLISLGISMQLPEGYEALVVPRSSTFKNWGILQTNSVGVIDEDYCGTDDIWRFPCFATRESNISKGDRICQFRIFKHQPPLAMNMRAKLEGDNRGGFGSTGVK